MSEARDPWHRTPSSEREGQSRREFGREIVKKRYNRFCCMHPRAWSLYFCKPSPHTPVFHIVTLPSMPGLCFSGTFMENWNAAQEAAGAPQGMSSKRLGRIENQLSNQPTHAVSNASTCVHSSMDLSLTIISLVWSRT